MNLIAVKIALTPTLMWGVSAAARRWGSLVGGLLSGLPLTSAPISIYLAVEQGERFAAEAAVGSVEGLGAVALCAIAYAACARRMPALASAGAGLGAFVLGGVALHGLGPGLMPTAAIDVALIAVAVALCPAGNTPARRSRPPRWDMPARLLAATALVVLVSGLAPALGPAVSGILAPIPIISWPLVMFARVQEGVGPSLDVVRGSVQGSVGVLAFYVCVHHALGQIGMVWAYGLAIALASAFVLPWLFVGRVSGGRRGA